jgi:hypothetical protein
MGLFIVMRDAHDALVRPDQVSDLCAAVVIDRFVDVNDDVCHVHDGFPPSLYRE